MAISDRTYLAFILIMAVSIGGFSFVAFELLRDGDAGDEEVRNIPFPEEEVRNIPFPADVTDAAFFRNLTADQKKGVERSRGWTLNHNALVQEASFRLTTYGEAMETMGWELVQERPKGWDKRGVVYASERGMSLAPPPDVPTWLVILKGVFPDPIPHAFVAPSYRPREPTCKEIFILRPDPREANWGASWTTQPADSCD